MTLAWQDPAVCLAATTVLIALGTLLSTLEWLWNRAVLRPPGLLSWQHLQTHPRHRGRLSRLLSPLFGFHAFLAILGVRAAAALLLLAFPSHTVIGPAALAIIVFTHLVAHRRSFPLGFSGADRMRLVVCGALGLHQLAPNSPMATTACLWFIALQACLSYLTAGLIKLGVPQWRHGDALVQVVNHDLFGHTRLGTYLLHHPGVSRLLTWGVLLFEMSFTLVLIIGFPIGWVFLGLGLLFHLVTALVMGFNHFVWSWVATYPAVVYCVFRVQGWLYG